MIFVAEGDAILRKQLVDFLRSCAHEVEGFETAASFLEATKQSGPDVVIIDMALPEMTDLQLVRRVEEIEPSIVRLLIARPGESEAAVAAMRKGCHDYLEKPVDLERLKTVVERVFMARRSNAELFWARRAGTSQFAPKEQGPVDQILGDSAAMRELRDQVRSLARLGLESPPVLIAGETGVGKGLVSRTLHTARFGENAPWIEINCAALPANLVEAELFGYERSAFTDAKQAKPGLFEAAHGGTIFLDEIGELPLDLQAKLLSVLESSQVRRLGGVRSRSFQAAVLAASNVELKKAVRDGQFRADLYHRLAAFVVQVPALRERGQDAVMLARKFAIEGATRYRKAIRGLNEAAEKKILSGRWPGNVRELRFAIERGVIVAPSNMTLLDAESISIGSEAPPAPEAPKLIARVGGDVEVDLPEAGVAYEDLERAILKAALDKTGGNVSAAAKLLGLQRDAMRYRVKKLGLE